ncbi:MAG: hypothetical protein ABJO67_05240 [Pseudoruegeria sp.]
MPKIISTPRRLWKSAQLYIGFHKDQNGKRRDTAKVWPPKNGNASIHAVPSEQETFLVLKSAGNSPQEDIQIKFRPDSVVLRRDTERGWEGIKVNDDTVSIRVNGMWIKIGHDGSISHERNGDLTYVEADGSVLKRTEFAESMMSGDGVALSRRTETSISAINEDGIVARARDTIPE